MTREERRTWLDGLVVGSVVCVSEQNGSPVESWLKRTIAKIEPVSLKGWPDRGVPDHVEDALYLDDGGRFARDDGRCLMISDGRRVYMFANERIEPYDARYQLVETEARLAATEEVLNRALREKSDATNPLAGARLLCAALVEWRERARRSVGPRTSLDCDMEQTHALLAELDEMIDDAARIARGEEAGAAPSRGTDGQASPGVELEGSTATSEAPASADSASSDVQPGLPLPEQVVDFAAFALWLARWLLHNPAKVARDEGPDIRWSELPEAEREQVRETARMVLEDYREEHPGAFECGR